MLATNPKNTGFSDNCRDDWNFGGGSNGRPGARRVYRNYDIGRACDEIRRQFRHTIKLVLPGHDREIQIDVLAVTQFLHCVRECARLPLRLGWCQNGNPVHLLSECIDGPRARCPAGKAKKLSPPHSPPPSAKVGWSIVAAQIGAVEEPGGRLKGDGHARREDPAFRRPPMNPRH